MDDLINRRMAIDAINGLPKWIDTENGVCLDYADVIAVLSEHLPSAQPMRKKGKWKRTYLDHVAMGERPSILYCSVCSQCIAYPVNFCPSCGADMRGDPNE